MTRAARRIVGIGALILLTAAAPVPPLRVHLLGTGGPELTPNRAGPATLIEQGDPLILVDAGRGVIQRLYEQRINPRRITRILLTHLHSDHIAGLPDLWMTPWFLLGRTAPLEVWGPPGTQAMIDGMRAMYAHDVAGRANAFNPVSGLTVTVHEIAPGPVVTEGPLTVSAFAVEHADGNPAFGYRIESGGHVAVLTGDTTLTPGLDQAAQGADLIVANVIAFSPRLSAQPEMQGVLAKLLTPEQAARLFGGTRPRLAVFSHIVKKELNGAAGDATILARTRAAGWRGPLAMARDRDIVTLGDRPVLQHGSSTRGLPDLDSKSAPF